MKSFEQIRESVEVEDTLIALDIIDGEKNPYEAGRSFRYHEPENLKYSYAIDILVYAWKKLSEEDQKEAIKNVLGNYGFSGELNEKF